MVLITGKLMTEIEQKVSKEEDTKVVLRQTLTNQEDIINKLEIWRKEAAAPISVSKASQGAVGPRSWRDTWRKY